MAYIRFTRIVVLTLAGLSVAAAQVTPLQIRSLPAAGMAELDEFVRTRQTAAKIPGLSVAVGFHGQVIYSKGFGAADLENGVQVTPNTAFRTASLAKPMTATAVMTLVEAG